MGRRKRKGNKREGKKSQRKRPRKRWMPWLLLAVALAGGYTLWVTGSGSDRSPAVGEAAPGFTLPSNSGGTLSLADYKGKRPVVLVFYMFSD